MKRVPKVHSAKAPQQKKFEQAARELGIDEGEATFDAKLKKVASAQPTQPDTKKRVSKKGGK